VATKKRVKFLKAWQMVSAGAEMELDAPIADLLIQRGRAIEVKAEAPLPTTAPQKAKRGPRLKGRR
jgi:hypothetical protein